MNNSVSMEQCFEITQEDVESSLNPEADSLFLRTSKMWKHSA